MLLAAAPAVALALALAAGTACAPPWAPPAMPAETAGQSRTDAGQIASGGRGSSAFLTGDGDIARPQPLPEAAILAPNQVDTGPRSLAASQISSRANSSEKMTQLSKAELDATLAQLSPAERKVLFEAIRGTDICDNPPQIAAIRALCQSRIETRSGEFAAPERPLSSEERLLQGGFDNGIAPSVERVIERLARNAAESGDPSNQAIASIALGTGGTAVAAPGSKPEDSETAGLSGTAQDVINAIVQGLGGAVPGPP